MTIVIVLVNCYPDLTFRTRFGTVLKIKSIELVFEELVCSVNFFDLCFQTVIQVDARSLASFEGMSAVFAVQTKQKLTVLTSTSVFRLFEVGEAFTTRHGTPTDVIHLRNCVFKAKLFVFLNQLVAQPHAFDVVIVKAFSAFVLCACDLRNLAVLYLELDKFLHALKAEIVLATREKEELFTHQVSLADSTEVLFVIKLPFEGPLTLSDEHEEVGFASKFKPHFFLVLSRTFDL